MKKVLLVLSVAMAAIVMTSCFGRECVCSVKVDGKKESKSIDYKDKCEKTGKWTVEKGSAESNLLYGGKEAEIKCK